MLTPSTITLAVILPLLTHVLFTRYRKHLSNIPGPFLASFSNLWKIKAVYYGEMHKENVKVHQRYGPVVRIGPNHVSFASPEALKTIYTERPTFPKSDFYKPGGVLYNGKRLENLFSLQDVDHHARLKRTLLGLYTKTSVLDLEPRIDDTVRAFLGKLEDLTNKSGGKTILDMSLWLHFFTFDSLADINLSRRFGFLDAGVDVRGILETADRILHITGLDLQIRIKSRWTKTRPNPLLLQSVAEVHKRLENQDASDKQDMLSKLIKLREENPAKISLDEMAGSLYINLMAGHDVLAITLRTIFHNVSKNARVLTKLRDELDSLGEPQFGLKPDTIPYSKLVTLPYLDAVIYEAHRIHVPIGVTLERVIPNGGATVDGYYLPEGTVVGVNGWVMHRDTAIFGEDVDVFRPERWTEVDEGKRAEMKRYIFSFGDGSRKCIGQNLAMAQTCKVVAELFRRFDFAPQENSQWQVHGSFVTNQSGLKMEVSRRDV
ncbi:cytochrome P450 oxidoreductase [Periconia macrospinosa]|uniref:Cytochrome P450 oxidoreductase n=1 Tax=Periconia macrospinosa TaxID=97972 RepID=A0A2V1D0S2_9PLEO|nr:cytochrome P450 oxidoreductase [Periconia macrospinosa]